MNALTKNLIFKQLIVNFYFIDTKNRNKRHPNATQHFIKSYREKKCHIKNALLKDKGRSNEKVEEAKRIGLF